MFLKNKIILIIFLLSSFLYSETTIVYNNVQNQKDKRKLYEVEILKLALDKTVKKYGKYKLVPGPKMNLKRAIHLLETNKIKNFLLKLSASEKLMDKFIYTKFPVDRGVTGYRVSFISPKLKNDLKSYDTIEEIKKLSIGQGYGWLDNDILRYNGFKVKDISSYEGLFNMVSRGRIDFFSRGINEVLGEYKAFSHIKNLDFDRTFILYYPLPRFFFSHKSNKEAVKRVEEGLILAYEDGSLDKVFDKYYKKSIDFLDIEKRKIYKFENPFLKGMDTSYENYIFDPFKKE